MVKLHIKRRLLAYVKTLRPLFFEIIGCFRGGVLLVIIPGFMAVASELAGISIIYLSFAPAPKEASGWRGEMMRQVSEAAAGLGFLLPVILLALAAAMYFLSSFLSVKFANLFAEHSAIKLHEGLRSMQAWPQPEVTRDFSTIQKLNRVQRNALTANARIVRILISLWAPLLLFLGSYILLFFMSFNLGITVSFVLAILAGMQAAISVKSAQSNSRWENITPKAFSELRKELELRVGESDTYSKGRLQYLIKSILSIQKDRILVTAYSQSAVSIGLVITLATIFLYGSFSKVFFVEDLSGALALLVIVIRIFMSLRSLGGQITVINRFYPQLSRYFRLRRILEYAGTSQSAGTGEIGSTFILTDLPDNRLNRLRWRALLFGGREVDFDGTGKGLAVHLLNPAEQDKVGDKHVWVDLEGMRNDPPVLCPAGDAGQILKRYKVDNRGANSESGQYDDEEDMV